ncbi:uncharacterized protein LOC108625174 isoform X2 [Ceratina calcarata]|uniref:Uncharacterized protein LOC108625174 isoform X2 n=1 Tax=Ceratina calcarata TaxID=156304 RepID=A0AAJ7WAU3_9HYME|nr:uncharacterized protein LOC108625174 isoform X2 [Ceratina calcarata]
MPSILTSTMSEQDEHTLKEAGSQQIKLEKLNKEQTKGNEYNQSSCSSDDGTESVYCIVSSEDETTHSYNDEDDDRYIDNEDMDEADRHRNAVLKDEGNDDYEEHRLRARVHDSDDTDSEYERDCFDRASDDFILSKSLKQHHKEQSLSLQDLSNPKHNIRTQYNKRKQGLIFKRKYSNLQPNLVAYSNIHRTIPLKYRRIENKERSMIKEQGNQFRGKNMKNQESTMNKNYEKEEDNDVDQLDAPSETIKVNIDLAVNEPQTEETQTANLIYNTVEIVENYENNRLPDRIIENGYVNTEDIQYNHIQNEKYVENSDDKLEHVNEPIDVSMQMECNDAEVVEAHEIANTDTSCNLKITNVKSIRLTRDESENFSFPKNNAVDRLNAELTELKTQLRQFHQKRLTENIKMQQEIDGLKKSLSKYEDESQTCETKDTIANGMIIETTSKQDIVASEQLNNQNENIIETDEIMKMSTSRMEPGISYTNEAEAVHNSAKSTESTNSTSFLNTEDNIATSTTSKKLTTLSPTFVTSTRILQTLSNIMQGQVEGCLPNNTNKCLNENSIQSQNQKSDSPIITSSKKRKAEVLGIPSYAPHFKIPNTNTEFENKNIINTTDVKLEYSVEDTNTKPKQEDDKMLIDRTTDDSICMETKVEYVNNPEDSVKYFVCKNTNSIGNGSFLIQAEEPVKDLENEKNRIQECGPFLLGNLEVRMSEVNGKVNIWGKKINQESDSDNEVDLELSEKLSQRKACWCDTSQTKFNKSPLVCSTNKKKKIPSRFNKSNISQCCNLHLNSINASLLESIDDKRYAHSSKRMSCESCSSSKCDNSSPRCNHTSSLPERIHSCCNHHTQTTNKVCNCKSYRKKRSLDVSCKCCKDKFHSVGIQQDLCKGAHMSNSKSPSGCINHQMACNTSSQKCYEVPLKRSTETAEMKKQKLTGERVRRILTDFLTAHEGGRDISATGSNENRFQQKESSRRLNDPQQIKSSTSTQDNDRYCRTCESQMAAQLGKLEMSMGRVQSRLDALVDMLNKPRPTDVN